MASTHVDVASAEWTPGAPFYGSTAVFDCRDIVQLKLLSDRRAEGGGIAWLVRMIPPEGKVIRIVAAAQSDEHIFSLEGGRGTKSGGRLRARADYGLNPKGKPHSAFIAEESVALVIYSGEPDEIRSLDVIDRPPP